MRDRDGLLRMPDTRHIAVIAWTALALTVGLCLGAGAQSVTIQGQLEASDAVWLGRITQRWQRRSDVVAKIVPEGTHVRKGDFVLKLDTAPMERTLEQAQSRADSSGLTVKSDQAKLESDRGKLAAQQAKGPSLLAPFTLEVERLEALPDPVDLAAAQAQVKTAQAALDAAESKYRALDLLAAKGMESGQDLQMARYDVQIATAKRDKAQAALDGVRAGADPFDLKIARLKEQKERLQIASDTAGAEATVRGAQIELTWAERGAASAQRQLEVAKTGLTLATRYAPKDGVVVYAQAREGGKIAQGSVVSHGYRIAAIISGTAFQFRGTATEAVLSRMRPGLAAQVRVEALPNKVLQGRVKSFDVTLSQTADAHPDAAELERPRPRRFEVVIALDKVPDGLLPGMSAQAEVKLAAEAPARDAFSARIARAYDGAPGGEVPLLLGGYVEPQQRAPVFVPARLSGYITYLAAPYARVKAGDTVLKCTADRAKADLTVVEDEPKFAQDLLDEARLSAEQDARQRSDQVQAADLDVQIAQAGLDRLEAPPRDCDVRGADAEVRRATAALQKARQKLSVEKTAGLASSATIDGLELDAELAEVDLEAAQLNRTALAQGPGKEKVRLAEFLVERARKQKALLKQLAATAIAAHRASVHEYEMRLEAANDRLRTARQTYDLRTMRAPVAGNVVFNPNPPYVSGRLRLGDTLPTIVIEAAYVADLSKLQFCAVLDQDDLSRVQVGRQVRVDLRALPGRALDGRVASLMPVLMDREEVLHPDTAVARYSGVRCSRAQIELDVPPALVGRILPGMTGTAWVLPAPDGQPVAPAATEGTREKG